MTDTVWLWQADGPRQGGRGVCGDRRSAQRAAADRLRSGAATAAVVEEAVTEFGTHDLIAGYCRTGEAWRARVQPAGRIRWVPAAQAGFLAADAVAAMFRVGRRTPARWAAAGKLTDHRTPGGRRRFDPAEVAELPERGQAVTVPRHMQAAGVVRAQVEDGTLRPGDPAPSAAALARATGISAQTCRKAIGALIADGILVPGASRNARPRVAGGPAGDGPAGDAARRLAALRVAAGLTQAGLAALIGCSVNAVCHAETGRAGSLGRRFWEGADKALNAGGELLRLYGACRVAAVLAGAGAARVTITWGDGTATTVRPPSAGIPP